MLFLSVLDLILTTLGVQCMIASIQYFSQTSLLEWHKIGENFCFSNPGKQRWIFDQISHFQLSSNMLYQATGLFSHPNLFGGFLFFSLLNASYLYVIHQKKWIKWLLTTIIFMCFFALSISFCVTAIIACVIGIVVWTLIQYFWAKDISYRKEIKKVGFIFFLSGIVCLTLFYQQFFNQMVHYANSEKGTYQVFFQVMKTNPWIGVGFDHFQLCNNPARYGIYLLIVMETGIMGLAFFSAFLFCILKKAITKLFSQEQALFLSIVIGFLWIGCCDCYFVEQMYGKYLFFIPLALFSAVIQKTNVLQSNHSLQKKIFLPRS
jgi:O-antigen ligase